MDETNNGREGAGSQMSGTEGPGASSSGKDPGKNADLSGEQQIINAYKISEENFRNSLEACPLGIRVVTAEGKLFYANRAVLDLWGYSSVKELKAVTSEQVYTPESHAEHLERKIKRSRGEYVPSEYEISIRRRNGEIRTLQVFRREITWGGQRQYMVMYQDITGRLKMEATIRHNADLIENAQDAIVSSDTDHKIQSWNKGAQKMYGWQAAEVIGNDLQDIVQPVHLLYPHEQYDAMLRKNDYWIGEDIHTRRNGEKVPVLMSTSVIRDKNHRELSSVTVTRDIAALKKIEDQLKTREEFLNSIIENAPNPLWVSDAGGLIIRINQALRALLQVKDEEIVGKYNVLEDVQLEEQGLMPLIRSVFQEGRTINFTLNYRPRRKARQTQDSVLIMEIVMSPVKDAQGRVINVVCQQNDLTRRVNAEDALRESQKMFYGAFHYSPGMNAIVQRDTGKIVEINEALCRVTGYKREEVLNKTVLETGTYFDTEQRETIIAELLKKDSLSNIELKLRMKNGEIRFFDANLSKVDLQNEAYVFVSMIDITARKEVEAALQAGERRFRSALDNLMEDCQIFDRELRYTYVNDSAVRFSHLRREEMLGRKITEVFPGVEKVASYAAYQKCLVERIPIRMEFRSRHADGTPFWLDLNIQPIPEGVFVLSLDITERKMAELAIHDNEERFRRMFQSSPLGISLSNLDYRYTHTNKRYSDITGYTAEELKNMTFKDLSFPEDTLKNDATRERLIKGEINFFNLEKRIRRKNGSVIWCSITVTTIRDNEGKPQGYLSMMQDITSRKEDEERITRLNLALRAIRSINQLITREKNRGRLIQQVCDTLVTGRSFHSAFIVLFDENLQPDIWAGTNIARGMDGLIKAMRRGDIPRCVQKAMAQDKIVLTKDPSIQCSSCPIVSGDKGLGSMTVRLAVEGYIYGILCGSTWDTMLTDEEEISLFSEVAADITFALRDIALGSTNEMLQQEQIRAAKLESIGTLAGGIAHDFNNLLTGIMGNIGLAKTLLPKDSEIYEMLDEAEKAAVRSRDLTQQLLTFARGGKPIKKVTDITGTIRDAATFALRGSKVKLELDLPEELWLVDADEGQISQVIHNLVINADEAMPEGGVLKITAKNLSLHRHGSLPLTGKNYVQIDVADTGTGISRENMQKIFEPYFTTKKQGSGLGLTTAYSIINNHGGSLLAESGATHGSIFHIYLPALRRAAKGEKKVAVKKTTQVGGRVLIMDDDEVIRKMLKNMLSLAGYEAEVTADGAEALENYKQSMQSGKTYNAVIMDLTIPGGMGGKEAIGKLLEIDPGAAVIVSSGYATDPIMSEYKKYGFSAVIAKPYSIQQLQETIAGLTGGKKRRG